MKKPADNQRAFSSCFQDNRRVQLFRPVECCNEDFSFGVFLFWEMAQVIDLHFVSYSAEGDHCDGSHANGKGGALLRSA